MIITSLKTNTGSSSGPGTRLDFRLEIDSNTFIKVISQKPISTHLSQSQMLSKKFTNIKRRISGFIITTFFGMYILPKHLGVTHDIFLDIIILCL